MRCGWVNNSKPSLRAIAASVMPAASAVRMASAVGADTATIRRRADDGGLLHHLHRHAARQQHHAAAHGNRAARQSAGELVERIVTADILAQRNEPRVRPPEAAAWTARVWRLSSWRGLNVSSACMICAGVKVV